MSKFKKVIKHMIEVGKIDTIVSAVSLIACILMVIILGVTAAVCSLIEYLVKNHQATKRG